MLQILNFKMRRKNCLIVLLVVSFSVTLIAAIEEIDTSHYAQDNKLTKTSSSVWSLKAKDLLANRKRREGDDDKIDEKFRINSPRKRLDDDKPINRSSILVKLPENIEEQMNRHRGDRQRLREAMLGFPAIFPTNSQETPEEDPVVQNQDESDFRTTATTSTTSTRRSNSHPQQTRQNGEVRTEENDVIESATDRSSSTTRAIPTGVDEAPWEISQKNEDSSGDSLSKREPTSSRSVWSIAWEAHVYFSGTLFVLLAIYCSVNILRLHTFSTLFSRGYFVSLNLCLVIIGLLRPIWLFHDPYNVNLTWPRYGAYLLVDTGLPCMTTAFAVLFLALLRATMIELVSPSFQTPTSLGIFCGCHFLLTFAVDITVGLFYHLRYMVLILQGVFIVWSLLLSAGYFYIFSAMNKIAMRQQGDFIRAVYPKLVLEGTVTYSDSGQIQPLGASSLKRPPLARAVHLTLGVAILGSLLGGVQLFGMIKMLALIKEDMSPNQNEWAWYGYQVSMRILEVTLCTLLAVIATTPLQSEFDLAARMSTVNGTMMTEGGGLSYHGDMMMDPSLQAHLAHHDEGPVVESQSCLARIFCCHRKSQNLRRGRRNKDSCRNSLCCTLCTDTNPPREFEDEIYSEICSNNHSVRQVMSSLAANSSVDPNHHYASTLGRTHIVSNGTQPGTLLPLGTLNSNNHLALGSNTLLPYKRSGNGNHYPSQSQTLLRSTNYHDGVRTTQGIPGQGNSMASSRATLDTALYSNVRSRPSSMLFNDSGFVRFRMGGDPQVPTSTTNTDVANTVSQDLDRNLEREHASRPSNKEREKLRASQSFDESVLFLDIGGRRRDDKLSPASQPDNLIFDVGSSSNQAKGSSTSPVYNSASDQELRELDPKLGDLDENQDSSSDSEEEEEGIYEAPPGAKKKNRSAGDKEKVASGGNEKSSAAKQPPQQQNEEGQMNPSESDEPLYSGKSIYGRAPSQCSSISATQSFDMRMYGRLPPQQQKPAAVASATAAFATLQKTEKLENPFYYYGSTRNQKKFKSQIPQKPRPLLPSQRQALELASRTPSFTSTDKSRPRSQMDVQRPSSRQALIPQYHQEVLERQQRIQEQLQQQQQLQQLQQQQQQLQQLQQQQQQQSQNFQRSRSLGHHYQPQSVPQHLESFYQQPVDTRQEPFRNQQIFHQQQPGSMTPVSYSRWHHSRQQQLLDNGEGLQVMAKRHNPLYDTPPSQRHAQQLPKHPRAVDNVAGYIGEVRGVMGTQSFLKGGQPPQQQQRLRLPSSQMRQQLRSGRNLEPVLSPILTDQELSPLHRPGQPDFLTDQSESENEEDQATQGYSEGLADNEQDEEESEMSSLFGGQDLENLTSPKFPGMPMPRKGSGSQVMSPLQYSAMLKLYSTGAEEVTTEPGKVEPPARKPSTNSTKQKSSFDGKEYLRLSTTEKEGSARPEAETLFSSSADDSDVQEDSAFRWDGKKIEEGSDLQTGNPDNFRWDGKKISDGEAEKVLQESEKVEKIN